MQTQNVDASVSLAETTKLTDTLMKRSALSMAAEIREHIDLTKEACSSAAHGSANPGSGDRLCPRCGGSGRVQDDAYIGAIMRKVRADMSLRELGMKLGFSAAYLSDLELGRRGWSHKLMESYRKHCTGSPDSQNAKLSDAGGKP